MAHDWSNALCPLNSVLVNPPVQFSAMGDFFQLLSPGACVGGVDPQDCFPRYLVALPRCRYLGVRRPTSGILGVPLFLPFGLRLFPGWNDKSVKAFLKAAPGRFPQLHMVDFVDDIRFARASGEPDALACGMTGFTSLLEQLGARYHATEGKRWRPTRTIPWLRFVVDTLNNVARMEERKMEKGLRISEALFGGRPG